MRVLFCGTRGWCNNIPIIDALAKLPKDTVVVHGAARGADFIAANEARPLGLTVEAHPANWTVYGRSAGYIRNKEMLDSGIDKVYAFWDGKSPGTKMMIKLAQDAGVPVEIIYVR